MLLVTEPMHQRPTAGPIRYAEFVQRVSLAKGSPSLTVRIARDNTVRRIVNAVPRIELKAVHPHCLKAIQLSLQPTAGCGLRHIQYCGPSIPPMRNIRLAVPVRYQKSRLL